MAKETCPHCGHIWESYPCCWKAAHNEFAICPKCRKLNIAFPPWTKETIKRQR